MMRISRKIIPQKTPGCRESHKAGLELFEILSNVPWAL